MEELQNHEEVREKLYLHRLLVSVHAPLDLVQGRMDKHDLSKDMDGAVAITWS